MTPRPWIDSFSPGYMQRGLPRMPRQGDRAPWINPQDYRTDRALLGEDVADDGALVFGNPSRAHSVADSTAGGSAHHTGALAS